MLHAAGWSAVHWPAEYGGRDATLMQWLLFEEEYYASGAPLGSRQNGLFLLGPTLLEHGTPEQRAKYLPPTASAEIVWAQAWSEPEAGSDLAAIRSTATKVEGGWRLTGQKTWSSRAAFADWGFGIFRSEPGSTRHHGLTYYLFPLTAEGISIRPIRQLDGETGFAEIFFDDVFVPDEDVLGGPGRGWSVAMATAASERGMYLRSPGRFMATADRLVDLLHRVGPARAPAAADVVARCWIDADAYRLYTFDSATRLAEGGDLGVSASVNKVFWSELDIRMHETALELLGVDGGLGRCRGRCGRRADGGWTATCSPWPGPSTPAPMRSNETSSPNACSAYRGSRDEVCSHRRPDGSRRGRPGAARGPDDR